MQRSAVTFDFHDTLVHCDEWFQLEVFHLPSAFLKWHERAHHQLADAAIGRNLDGAYRRLRTSIILHGHELSAERSISVVYAQAGIYLTDQVIAEGVREVMLSAMPGIRAVPGAVEAVRALAEQGVPLGVVSSAVHHPFLDWALEELGLLSYFDIVTTSASAGYYKSRPEIYWHTLSALNGRPSASIHVGDSARFDVDGAARAGMNTIWLNHGGSGKPSSVPTLTITSLSGVAPELLTMLADLS